MVENKVIVILKLFINLCNATDKEMDYCYETVIYKDNNETMEKYFLYNFNSP